PTGYSQIFVLTSGTGLVIEQVSATPSFTVNAAGSYTIHTLVYDADPNSANFLDLSIVQFGTTTGVDVLNLVTANGLCASLDVAGAPVHVNDCTADAGTLTIDQDPVFTSGGSATVSATPDGNAVVPTGYSQIYVLTSGSNLVIEQVSATPSFTVNMTGDYTIHTLVYDGDPNSPNFLDLAVVQFGVTTGVDVLNIVINNGLCASLDVAGAGVHVQDCVADAGSLTIDQDPVILANGSATVSATPDGNINVPAGYSVIYVLTEGPNLVIEQVSATPSFTVNTSADYTIHTLVYDADPNSGNFLDLSVVQFGVTTGVDVLTLVAANGLCASLDVAGAGVHVQNCTADAGTITIDHNPVHLTNGSATVSATPDGNIVIPTGYSVIYVLTEGPNLVIEQVSTTPSFVVSDTGSFTIHTLVYDGNPNSPNFLDLSVVQFGTTTGVDVLNLVTANGLCASLDVAGAPVHVVDLNGLLDFTATQNAWDVTLDWSVGNTVMGQSYKLGRSLDGVTYQVIHNVEEAETGVVSKDYQYVDTNPYNGQNYYKITHYDENGIFISELKLDIYFTPSTKPTLSVFPNPAIDILNLTRVDNLDDPTQVIITNLNGQKVMEVNSLLYGGESTTINVSTLPAGLYQVVMYDAQGNRISATKLQVN
ncbi:MAG: T9SS type A sorting domain-containing protein, partial [Bacteroidota bacterium]